MMATDAGGRGRDGDGRGGDVVGHDLFVFYGRRVRAKGFAPFKGLRHMTTALIASIGTPTTIYMQDSGMKHYASGGIMVRCEARM